MDDVFKYKKMRPLGFILASAFTAMTTCICVASIQRYEADQYVPVLVVFVPITSFVIAAAVLAYRNVVLSADGIRQPLLGLRGRLVLWDDIMCVRCGVLADGEETVTSYRIQTKRWSPVFGVTIMSLMDNAERLIVAIDVEMGRRQVPITAWRSNERITLTHLPKPERSSGWPKH